MVSSVVLKHTKVLWDFMCLNQAVHKADCILGLGCHDIHIAQRCAELYNEGYAKFVIFSGGLGKITSKLWNVSEAEKFAQIAISLGVPENKIFTESQSTNTGDNFAFTKLLVEKNKLPIKSFIVVTKPCTERRARAAFEKRMDGYSASYTSPQFSFEQYLKFYLEGPVSQEEFISTLVGDIQRFDLYYTKGFQTYVNVPQNVLSSYNVLIQLGFDKYIIR